MRGTATKPPRRTPKYDGGELPAVPEHEDDPVAALEATRLQRGRGGVDLRIELGPGEGARLADESRVGGAPLGCLAHQIPEVGAHLRSLAYARVS